MQKVYTTEMNARRVPIIENVFALINRAVFVYSNMIKGAFFSSKFVLKYPRGAARDREMKSAGWDG